MGKKVADKKMWHEDMRLNEIEQKKWALLQSFKLYNVLTV